MTAGYNTLVGLDVWSYSVVNTTILVLTLVSMICTTGNIIVIA